MLIFKILFTFLLYFSITCEPRKSDEMTTKENVTSEEGHKSLTVLEKWESLEKKAKNWIKEGIKMALPVLMENSGKLNLSKECMKSGLHLISGLKDLKPWAFEFFDSSGKVFDGLLTGSISSFGHYDQCLDIQVKSTKLRDRGKLLFGGQYCMIDIRPPLPPRPSVLKYQTPEIFRNFSQRDTVLSKSLEFVGGMYDHGMRMGLCIPSKCTKEDLSKIAHLLGSQVYFNTSIYRCEVKEGNEFTPVAITVITCYSFIAGLVLIATSIDAFVYNTDVVFKSKAMQSLLAFSLFTNFKKFSSTESSKSNSLSCLNGVRFIGMIWIIILHTFMETLEVNRHGWISALDQIKDFNYQIILNGSLSVDSFFFMGGLLVAHITMKLCKDQKHKFNAIMFIIYRLLRILPVYVFILMFSSLMHMFGSGPVWHSRANSYYQPCYKYWWTNIIFINNFYSMENSCFPTTWYVASDFQLYIFSLVIIIPLLRFPKIGIFIGILTIIASIIYTGIETYIKEYPPSVVFYLLDVHGILNYLGNFQFRPFIHAGPYAVGLLAGYLLAVKPEIKITPLFQVLGWSLAVTVCLGFVYGTADWYKNLEAPLVPSVIYASFKRTSWTLGVAWMIVCCARGYGGIVNYILSLNVFVPLGRLTFLAYLIHPIVQRIIHGNVRVRVQGSFHVTIYSAFGHMCVSYALAFVAYLFVELPFANLVRILMPREGKKQEHCNTGKGNDFLEADRKEDVIIISFASNGKHSDIDSIVVPNTNL